MATRTKATKEAHDPTEAARQITEKAERIIQDEQAQLVTKQRELENALSEKAQLEKDRAARATQITDLQGILARATETYQKAANYAQVAQGTVGEQKAVSDATEAQQRLNAALEHYTTAARECEEADQNAAARIATLEASITQLRGDIGQGQARIQETAQTRDRAFREVGERVHAGLMAEYDQCRTKVEEARAALTQTQIEERQFLEQHVSELAAWPDLHASFRQLLVQDDATARIIAAASAYVETLLSDGALLRDNLEHPATHGFFSWWQLLTVPSDELYVYEHLKARPTRLQERAERLKMLLHDYRQRCKQQA
jgi:chromosome segregation ATPase